MIIIHEITLRFFYYNFFFLSEFCKKCVFINTILIINDGFLFFSYYIEVLHSENTVGSNVRVAARHLDTKFVSPMTGFAKEEIQKIKVTSTGIQFFQSDFRKKLPKSIAIVKVYNI